MPFLSKFRKSTVKKAVGVVFSNSDYIYEILDEGDIFLEFKNFKATEF